MKGHGISVPSTHTRITPHTPTLPSWKWEKGSENSQVCKTELYENFFASRLQVAHMWRKKIFHLRGIFRLSQLPLLHCFHCTPSNPIRSYYNPRPHHSWFFSFVWSFIIYIYIRLSQARMLYFLTPPPIRSNCHRDHYALIFSCVWVTLSWYLIDIEWEVSDMPKEATLRPRGAILLLV